MSAWIELDGVRSTSFEGVMVESITPFLMPRKKATRTAVSGRLGAIDNGEATIEEADIDFTLVVKGTDRANVMQKARSLTKWLNGTKLKTYLEPDKYCVGQIESEIVADKLNLSMLRMKCEFTAVPPCMYKAPNGFEPDMNTPIPEQITAANANVDQTLSSTGRLTAVADNGTYSPALHFAVSGTWEQLSIGDLVITQSFAAANTVYIDCENQVIYTKEGANKVSVAYSGSFPENDADGILIGGTSFNAHIMMMLIERW